MNVFGLGKAGCNIAKLFNNYSYYNVYLFDCDVKYKNKKNHFFIPERPSAELYDSNEVKFKIKLNKEEIILFVCGSGKISACTLWLLRRFKDHKITVYYIFPDLKILDNKSKLRNRAHFHVLQEYARSGVFSKIYLIDNQCIKEAIGKVPVLKYYERMNKYIFDSIHLLNVYQKSDAVFDTFQSDLNTCRIATISAYSMASNVEKDFFYLKNVNQIKYFFGINRLRIEEDENLIDEVSSISSANTNAECISSYGIFQTDYDYDICYAIKSTAEVQIYNMEE